jgi:Na+-driven multidrug efflux pump
MMPVILNELFWSLGITAYSVIYGRMGTDSIAAINIVGSVEQVAFTFFIAISNATSVNVGNRIGAGKEDEAYTMRGARLGWDSSAGSWSAFCCRSSKRLC